MGLLRIKGKKNRIYARFYYLGRQREEPLDFYCSNSDKGGGSGSDKGSGKGSGKGNGGGSECKCRDHKAARAQLAEIEGKISAGIFDYKEFFPKSSALEGMGLKKPAPSITFGTYSTIWLEQQTLAFSTAKSYRRIIHSILIPALGMVKIHDLIPFHLRALVKELIEQKKKPKYIKNIIGVFSSVTNSAIADGLLDKNPAKLVKLPKIETAKADVFNLEEIAQILDYAEKRYPHMVLFFAIGFYMGLRTGEIMGLRWGDFDFKNNKLKVQRTITEGQLKNSVKTSEYRIIDIPPILDRYINRHKVYTFLKWEWVFSEKGNGPIKDYNTITYKYWKLILKGCGLRYRQAYQMRRSFASNSLAAGFAVAWVQEMLGHSTPAMLFKRYGNYIYKSSGRQGFKCEELSQHFPKQKLKESGG